jgi:hypothetical protein
MIMWRKSNNEGSKCRRRSTAQSCASAPDLKDL